MTVLSGVATWYRPYLSRCPGTIMGHLSLCPEGQENLNPLESLVITTVDSDDSVVGSRYMVSTMLIWIVQQDSGKSLSFFLLLRSTCFTADRQPTNSAARWRHCRYFYTVARKLRRCSSSSQPAAASALAFACTRPLPPCGAAVAACRCVAVLGGGRGLELAT